MKITRSLRRRLSTLLLTLQIVLSVFGPLFVLVPTVSASENNIEIEYSQEESQLNLKNYSGAYALYYLVAGSVFADQGQAEGDLDLILNSASGNDEIKYAPERLVLKTEAATYLVVDGKLSDYSSDNLELSDSDKDFLYSSWEVDETARLAITKESVELGVSYSFPLNEQVKVKFTKLPENSSPLTIKEVKLTEELQADLGSLSDIAYDITTEMEDGDFEFELELPMAEEASEEEIEVKYAETVEELASSAKKVEAETRVEDGKVKVEALDHMTLFVVTFEDPQDPTPANPGYNDIWFDYAGGVITQVPSGTNGISSADGSNHAEITGPVFTRWGGYNNTFPAHGYDTKLDVYLDMSLADGSDTRFDFSSAINTPTGSHRRDFIIHLGTNSAMPGQWLVSASNNSPGWPGNPGRSPADITETGWYTIEHSFRDDGSGVLAVTISLYKKGESTPVGSWVLSDPSDIIGVTVGGNRYGWFPSFGFSWLAIDNAIIENRDDTTAPVTSNIKMYVSPDGVAPFVEKDAVKPGDHVRVEVEATDNEGVDKVEFRIQNKNTGAYVAARVFENSPVSGDLYRYEYVVPADGKYINTHGDMSEIINEHRYWARAYDAMGNYNHGISEEFTFDKSAPAKTTGLHILNEDRDDLDCEGYTNSRDILIDWNDAPELDFDHYLLDLKDKDGHRSLTVSEYDATIRDIDGYYKYKIRTVDEAGNIGEASDWCGVTLDRVAPDAPSLVSPTNNSVVTGATLTSDWTTVADAHHYIYESYHDAGATNLRWHAEYTASEKTATNVADSTFWWRVKAVDNAGNESAWSELWKVTIDNTAPVVQITNPSDTDIVQGTVDIRGYVTDANLSHYNIAIYPGGVDVHDFSQRLEQQTVYGPEFSEKSLYSWDTTGYSDGEYQIRLAARDLAGNRELNGDSEMVITVTVDNSDPSTPTGLHFLNPDLACGAITNSKMVTVDWDDSTDHIAGYNYKINYPLVGGGRGNWQTFFTTSEYRGSLNEGIHYIQVQAKDVLGRYSAWSDECSITYDSIAPVVAITSPMATLLRGTVEVRGTVTDANPHHYWLVIQNSGGSTVAGPGVVNDATSFTDKKFFDWDTTGVADGDYIIKLEARDSADNKDAGSVEWKTVTIDNIAPTVTVSVDPVSPDGDNGWYVSQPTVTLTGSDNHSLDRVEYHWDTDAWSTYSVPLLAAEGTHTLYYRAIDAAGNMSSEGSLTLNFDQTAPSPGPENVRITSLSLPTATLEWDSASDSISGIEKYDISWKLKGGIASYGDSVGAGDNSVGLHSLTDGEWEIRVKALDNAGNWTETLLLYTIGGGTGTAGETTTTSNPPATGAVLGVAAVGGFTPTQRTGEVEGVADEASEEEQAKMAEEIAGEVQGTSITCSTFNKGLFWLFLVLEMIVLLLVAKFSKQSWLKIASFFILPAILSYTYLRLGLADCYQNEVLGFLAARYYLPAYLTAIIAKLVEIFFIVEE